MPDARIYDLKREQLGKLLQQIDGPSGATLLIPNLQRPFVWEPHQVTMLMDSLLRGWPFGTLLLWRIDTTSSQALIPSRPFWTMSDRTDEPKPAEVSQCQPPAQFTMVLDGQQRMQSLILAVGGDDFGFRLLDTDWYRSVEGQPRRGRQARHWSKGGLFLDVPAFSAACAKTSDPRNVDYTKVLAWVVGDAANGRSKMRQPASYKFPIPRREDHPGRYVRLSRLWSLADNFATARPLRPVVRQLLIDYGFSIAVLDRYVEDVAELVLLLGQVKVTDVSYLELQPYRKEAFDEGDYNDAVVNIFTRLNTAGRTLSEQEISYAWIKSYWDTSKTGGRQADECFAALREGLTEHGLKLDDDSVVRIVSTMWSALQNGGALLSSRDLLKPDRVKRLASGANERWDRLKGAALWTADRVEAAGLKYRTHYESLNAVIVLMAWRAVGSEWLEGRKLTVPARDEFEKLIVEAFDRVCVRWFAVTQWARVWAVAAGKSFAAMHVDLAQTCAALEAVTSPADAVSHLEGQLERWLTPLISQGVDAIEAMAVAKREQVSQYYLPLWVWHRLNEARSEYSKLVFQDGKKESSLDVDHLVAAKAWERLIGPLEENERQEIGPTVNDLGNCWLMKKNFNISKSDGTLAAFLNKVKEFKSGEVTLDDFGRLLGVTDALFDPAASGVQAVRDAIETRTQEIKEELKAFVRGQVVPGS